MIYHYLPDSESDAERLAFCCLNCAEDYLPDNIIEQTPTALSDFCADCGSESCANPDCESFVCDSCGVGVE